jgi:UDPglucose--hexose-1-phosphate uridylyltransferase
MASPSQPRRDSQVHHDEGTGRSVFVAPSRAERPGDAALAAAHGTADATAWCPFCAGNESRTPPDVLRVPADPAADWQARIVPNRYPFVEAGARAVGAAGRQTGHGVHDVVIESPQHVTSILAVEPDAWRATWQLVQRRLADLALQEDLAWGTVFKNSGPRAGASLEHVHSQLVAIDFVPMAVRAELEAAGRQAEPFADLLAAARQDGRIVAEAGGLVALVPPAPRQPCETWIVPAAREPFFHSTAPARAAALADLTRDLAGRLAQVLPGVDYNWWLHEAAWRKGEFAAATDRWHWHLEILPRATELAGFELATGCHITPLAAAEAAARLRDA